MYDIEWNDIIDFLKENRHVITKDEKRQLLDVVRISDDIDFDDVMDYLNENSLTTSEEEEILEVIDHECKSESNQNERTIIVENLDDEFRFETLKKLYNTLTLDQLEKIEKMVELKVI
jgi:hypothetical protein